MEEKIFVFLCHCIKEDNNKKYSLDDYRTRFITQRFLKEDKYFLDFDKKSKKELNKIITEGLTNTKRIIFFHSNKFEECKEMIDKIIFKENKKQKLEINGK